MDGCVKGVMPKMEKIEIGNATVYTGDVLKVLKSMPDESVHVCITSPP